MCYQRTRSHGVANTNLHSLQQHALIEADEVIAYYKVKAEMLLQMPSHWEDMTLQDY
jgi:hypothetical protein